MHSTALTRMIAENGGMPAHGDGWSGNRRCLGLPPVRNAALADVAEALQDDDEGHAAAVAVKKEKSRTVARYGKFHEQFSSHRGRDTGRHHALPATARGWSGARSGMAYAVWRAQPQRFGFHPAPQEGAGAVRAEFTPAIHRTAPVTI
jgi:hypothetical protein